MKVESVILMTVAAVFLVGQPIWADSSQWIALIPQPQKLIRGNGEFVLAGDTAILADKDSADAGNVARQFVERINRSTGLGLAVSPSDATGAVKNAILLTTKNANASLGAEGYVLEACPPISR
jgi:hypothetical protein